VKKIVIAVVLSTFVVMADSGEGEKLFKTYCWGCHHQTAEAFGPSFKTIASKRDKSRIIAMIADPDGTFKSLGYKRNSMPSFGDLKPEEMQAIADYIMKFKDVK